jgi:hypothetical protein
MSYARGNAPFVDDGTYAEDLDDNVIYETDVKGNFGLKPTRKSTKGRKLKRWDGKFCSIDFWPAFVSCYKC